MAPRDPLKYAERPLEGLKNLCTSIWSVCVNRLQNKTYVLDEDIIEMLGLFQALAELVGVDSTIPPLTGQNEMDLRNLHAHFEMLKTQFTEQANKAGIEIARQKYLVELGHAFRYEFSDGDLSQIQSLLNDLRDQIRTSDFFNEKHKERLLKKLEELQAELHKRMSSLDKFYALAGEGAVIVGKYGEAAKPFLDIIKAILRIAWVAQGRAEELPSNAPNILIKTDDQEIV